MRFDVILRDKVALGVEVPEIVLRPRIALVRGLAISFHRLNVILSDAGTNSSMIPSMDCADASPCSAA